MKKKYLYRIVPMFVIFVTMSTFYFYNKNYFKPISAKNINKTEVTTSEFLKSDKTGQVNNVNNTKSFGYGGTDIVKLLTKKEIKDRPLSPKEIFLTFDDGPSDNTTKILKILDQYNVKATFFVIGKNVEEYPDIVKGAFNDGMSIVNHSYSHQYSMYKNTDECLADFYRCSEAIKKVTGIEPRPVIRFPGGSDNRSGNPEIMKNIKAALISKGYDYVDWNTVTGDAVSANVRVQVLENNIMQQLEGKKFSVALMHDAAAKKTTVEALPKIIEYLKNQGFEFRTFDDLTPTERNSMIKEKIVDRP